VSGSTSGDSAGIGKRQNLNQLKLPSCCAFGKQSHSHSFVHGSVTRPHPLRVQVPQYACGHCIGYLPMREVADAVQILSKLAKRDEFLQMIVWLRSQKPFATYRGKLPKR
jgi:hypothetical protein